MLKNTPQVISVLLKSKPKSFTLISCMCKSQVPAICNKISKSEIRIRPTTQFLGEKIHRSMFIIFSNKIYSPVIC